MVSGTGTWTQYMISSGGQDNKIKNGGIAIAQKQSSIDIAVRVRDDPSSSSVRRWTTGRIIQHTDEWFHLGVTWSKTGRLKAYINGVERASVREDDVPQKESRKEIESQMYVGARNHDSNHLGGNGKVDELQMWDYIKSSQQIKEFYSNLKGNLSIYSL